MLERGIYFTEAELNTLFESLKFESNKSDSISRLELYANAHLFKLDPEAHAINKGLMQRIAIGVGVGVTESDLQVFEKFSQHTNEITELANERNCMLYIDAE